MTQRILPAFLAIAFLATLPVDAAFARGGGGGGGGGGGMHGGNGGGMHGGNGGGFRAGGDNGGRGNLGYSRPQNPSNQRLYDSARKACSGAQYPSGATPRIDYSSNSFTCFEPGSARR